MAKRKGLDALDVAARAKGETAQRTTTAPDADDTLTTAIHIPRSTWKLLRAVAFRRAQERGGRPSVSALLVELAEERRKELEKEAGPFLE
jgi:hypothetical protein